MANVSQSVAGRPQVFGASPTEGRASAALAKAAGLHLDDKREEALEVLETAIASGVSDVELLSAKALLHYELGQFADAVRYYEQVLELRPEHPSAAYNLAVCCERLSRWQEASGAFRSALDRDPGRCDARLGLGISLLHQEQPGPALEAFERVLESEPELGTALFGKAVALQLMSKVDEAVALYRQLTGKNQHMVECATNLVVIAMSRKDQGMLREWSEKLLQLQPSSQTALEGLAANAFSTDDYEAAATYCGKLVEYSPAQFERWFNLGVAYHRIQRFNEATEAYQEALRLRPDAKQAYVNLGAVYQENGDLRSARASYEQALRIAPDLSDVQFNLAAILEKEGKRDEAERLYVRILSREPDLEDAWFRLGYLRLERQAWREAADAFLACVRRRPSWPEAQLNLALSFWNMGDREAAAKSFEAVLSLQPASLDALRGLAALAIEKQDFEQALDLQARLIEAGERSPELFYNTGLLLQKSGQVDDAIRLYNEALAERPDFPEALLNLGHALKAKGNEDEARSHWRQALSARPELAQGYFDK